MWSKRTFLEQCEKLRESMLAPTFTDGEIVSRGFADLGFEEFLVLPGKKLLSLQAGTVGEIPEQHRHFFFRVPSVDDMINLMENLGLNGITCDREDQRIWKVKVEIRGEEYSFSAPTLKDVLIQALSGAA